MKKYLPFLNSNRGFSLIEVVASVVIISIILISFSQFFFQSNKTAVYNNEKLVLLNLANAELERLKLTGYYNVTTSKNPQFSGYSTYPIDITLNECEAEQDCENLNISDITVTVTSSKTNAKASVEGFVKNLE